MAGRSVTHPHRRITRLAPFALAVGAGALAGLALVVGATLSPLVPLLLIGVVALGIFASLRPVWTLYLAILAIPAELLSLDFGGSFGLTPTEGLFVAAAAGWMVNRALTRQPLGAITPPLWPLLLLLLAMVPGFLLAEDVTAVAKQFVMWSMFTVLYLMITAEASRTLIRNIFIVLSIAGGVAAAIAIADRSATGFGLIEGGAIVTGRATSTFAHPAVLGLFLGMVLPMQIALSLDGPKKLRLLASGTVILSVLAIALSLARAAFLGVVAACLLMMLWRPFRRVAVLAFIVVLGLSFFGVNPAGSVVDVGAVWTRITSIGSAGQSDPRAAVYTEVPRIIADNPFFGVGAQNFYLATDRYGIVDSRSGLPAYHAHNIALNTAAELGLIGFGAMVWLGVLIVLQLLNAVRFSTGVDRSHAFAISASLLMLAVFGLFDYPLSANMVGGLAFTLVGLATAINRVVLTGSETAQPGARPQRARNILRSDPAPG